VIGVLKNLYKDVYGDIIQNYVWILGGIFAILFAVFYYFCRSPGAG
jgi:hypothetical protein